MLNENGSLLTPMAASLICHDAGLPPDKSVVLTVASMMLNGPLALAPALVAVEKHRAEAQPAPPSDQPSPPGGPVVRPPEPPVAAELATVPDLCNPRLKSAEAEALLTKLNLVPAPTRHWSADADKDIVLWQPTPPAVGVKVPGGTPIAYNVGAGVKPEPPAPAGDDDAAIAALRKDVDSRLEDLRTQMSSGFSEIKSLLAAKESPATPPPPAPAVEAASGGTKPPK